MNRKTMDKLLDDFCKEAEQDIIYVVGSQSLYGYIDDVPETVAVSIEVDVILGDQKNVARLDLEFGEDSIVREKSGCFVHILEEEALILPCNWKSRVREVMHTCGGKNISLRFLSPVDLCASKLGVGRDKDLEVIGKLLNGEVSYLDLKDIIKELPDTCRGSAEYNLTHKICKSLFSKKKNSLLNALENPSLKSNSVKP